MKKNFKVGLIILCLVVIGIVVKVTIENHKTNNDNTTKSIAYDEKSKQDSQKKEEVKKESKKQGILYKNIDDGINVFNNFFNRLDGGQGLYKLNGNNKNTTDFGNDCQQVRFQTNPNTSVSFDINKSTSECFQVHISTIMDGSKESFIDSNVMQYAAIGAFNTSLSDDDIMNTSKKLGVSSMILADKEKNFETIINGMTYKVNKSKKDSGMYSIMISITKEI